MRWCAIRRVLREHDAPHLCQVWVNRLSDESLHQAGAGKGRLFGHIPRLPRVHGREGEPCPRCGTAILKANQDGRGTYWWNVDRETDFGANNLAPIGRRRPDAVTRLGSRRQHLSKCFMVAHRTDDRQPPITSQKVHIHNPPYVVQRHRVYSLGDFVDGHYLPKQAAL